MAFHDYPYTDFHEMNLDWVIKKVKELATAWAQVQQDWTDEQTAFANLQSWIENYFNNLNVQTEINVKLDAMVEAGTMSELIAPFVASGLPAVVADQIGAVVAAQIGPVVAAQIGAVVADQLPAVAAAAAAAEVSAWLALHVNPETGYVIDDSFTVQGAAADAKAVGDEFTAIKSALTERTVLNKSYNRFDASKAKAGLYNGGVYYPNASYSYLDYPASEGDVFKFYQWRKYNESSGAETNELVPRKLSIRFVEAYDASGTLISGSTQENKYSYTAPEGTAFVRISTVSSGDNGRNFPYNMVLVNPTEYPIRFYPWIGDAHIGTSDWFEFSPVKTNALYGKNGVFFGDSITEGVGITVYTNYDGNRQDYGVPYPQFACDILKAECHNCGFGATRYSFTGGYSGASFPAIVDAIISRDFTSIQSYIDSFSEDRNKERKQEHLNDLETIDFTKIDFVCISYGTNDWASSVTLDNPNNAKDKTTILGGLRYGLDKLLTNYPKLRIFVITPIYRYTISESQHDSDTMTLNGITLRDLADDISAVAKEFHAPCIDVYNDGNISIYNHTNYLADGTHPNDKGYAIIGTYVSGILGSKY